MNYRAIWISDLHLGSRHAQAERLLDFLRDAECRHLYLVGDIIDGWELKRRWHWDTHANTVVQKILRKQRKDTKVTYLYGNHDEFLRNFVGVNLSGVRLAEQVVHITADKRRFLVLHGHQLDGLIHFNRLLERVGSRLYVGILGFNLYFNRARRRLGFGYWSVAAFLKYRAKSAVRYVTKFEEGMVQLASKAKVHGVICGHIHRAEMRRIHGMDYLNCGDWVESCTALVEHHDGSFELIHFNENPLHSPGRGPGPHDPGVGRPAMVPPEPAPGRGRAGRGAPQPELAGLF
jgi:UDP-2,3-diacylglucosamine pyrophosphatase LpxH